MVTSVKPRDRYEDQQTGDTITVLELQPFADPFSDPPRPWPDKEIRVECLIEWPRTQGDPKEGYRGRGTYRLCDFGPPRFRPLKRRIFGIPKLLFGAR